MGLYSSFSTSQYYDDEPIKKPVKTEEKPVEYKKPHQVTNEYGLTENKRKSLYEEAQKVASTKSEYSDKVDFRDIYRVGQMIRVQAPNGKIRTNKGRVVEIVAKDLMYVGMEDAHKDVNDNWLIDFVMPSDIITKI